MPKAISVSDLTFSWTPSAPPLMQIEDWQVEAGEHIFLHGPSGSGKSTLLNLLSGVLSPQSGQIRLLDQEITALSQRKRDQFRARHIGLIFQQFNLLPYLSINDNIDLASHFSGQAHDREFKQSLISQLGLEALQHQAAGQLSIGQQQRVAIARALINRPEVIIADEPTSALDSNMRDAFIQILLDTAADSTVIFVSHDQSLASHFNQQLALNVLNQAQEAH